MGNRYRGAFRGKMRVSDGPSPLTWPTIAGLLTALGGPAASFGFAFVADLPAGIVLVAFYLWRRDLVANMLAHSSSIAVARFTMVPPPVSVWFGQFR